MAGNMVLSGIKECMAAMAEVDAGVTKASASAARATGSRVSRRIKSKMNGAPRSAGRGAMGSQPAVRRPKSSATPHRPGPIGKLTGDFRKGIGYKTHTEAGTGLGNVVAWVGLGGTKMRQNNVKRHWENDYPFFFPTVEAMAPEVEAIYSAAFVQALARKGINVSVD